MIKNTEISAPDFDLEMTLDSGQVFHWEKHGAGFIGMIRDVPIYVEQHGEVLKVRDGEAPSPARQARALPRLIKNYLALDHPLKEICRSFPREEVMDAARDYCRGLRIIRQPRWECLATFICSSMKQVAHIRQISAALRCRYGEPHKLCGLELHSFPTAQRVAQASERELCACALGYRAKNLLATARLVASGKADLEKWSSLSDEELCVRLCALPGVGAKVANCVLLFAYERLRAFPIDVWIERVLRQKYFARKRQPTTEKLHDFAGAYFGKHGGYAQQYLFHHARKTTSRRRAAVAGTKKTIRGATERVPPEI